LKQYFLGYYCANESEIEVLSKQSNRIVLDALTESYPTGLNANELVQRTRLPLKTVYSALKELNRELFINELGKQRKTRGRPLLRSVQSNGGERQRAKYVIEDIGRI
jgi:hypothetical protein